MKAPNEIRLCMGEGDGIRAIRASSRFLEFVS